MSLALYFIVYFLLAFVWRTALVYKRTGVNPLVLPSSDNVYGYVGRAFKAAIAGCVVLVAQAQMGNSWRIGVDPKLTELVQRGLFRFSRNPIFLSLRITLLGLFLVTTGAQ